MCVRAPLDEDIAMVLHVSSSDSNVAGDAIGNFSCQVASCSAAFRRKCQLATHYEEFHPCVFDPPRDKDDLELYNRYMATPQPTSGKRRKRRRQTSPRGGRPKKKRTRTKSTRY